MNRKKYFENAALSTATHNKLISDIYRTDDVL